MNKKDFTNRKIDQISVEKSKKLLWNQIAAKIDQEKEKAASPKFGETISSFLKSLFIIPSRLASLGAISALLILAVIAYQFNFIGIETPTVYANFEMTADESDSSGVESDSSFTITASEDIPTDTLKDILEIYPEAPLNIEKISAGKYKVTPEKGLEADTVYRFEIKTADQDYSWAYQIKDTFKITGTIPGDKTSSVPTNTGIEVNFSHENFDFENIEKYFQISPAIKGNFEHHQRTLSFVPQNPLKEATIYTVTVKEGLSLTKSDQKLTKDFHFQFETESAKEDTSHNRLSFRSDYYEAAENSPIAFDVYNYDFKSSNSGLPISIYEFDSAQQYLEALQEKSNLPNWARRTRDNHTYDTSKLKLVAEQSAMYSKINWKEYLYLPEGLLQKGYYLAEIQTTHKIQALLQITDLSAFVQITNTDSLVWVNDLSSGHASLSASVEIIEEDEEIQTETNSDGIATFKTPDSWKEKDTSTKIFQITTATGTETLFTVLRNYYDGSLESDYYYTFTTDRPVYLSKDTVKFWGFLKPKQGESNKENYTIQLTKDWDTLVKENKITLDENYNFSGEFKLNNLLPGYYTINVLRDEETVFTRSISIKNYVKPAYELIINSDKKAVFAGETLNVDIKSAFFEGTPVPGMQLNFNSTDSKSSKRTIKTDENGNAKLSFIAQGDKCSDKYCYLKRNFNIDITPTFSEEADLRESLYISVFNSSINLEMETSSTEQSGSLKIKANHIDLDKINSGESEHYYDYIGEVAKEQEITVNVEEISWEKTQKGQYYDFINKKVVPEYDYKRVETPYLSGIEITTDEDGEAEYDFTINPDRFYEIFIETKDDQGNISRTTRTIYGNQSYRNEDYLSVDVLNGGDDQYRKTFKVGDTVETAFSRGEASFDPEEEGRFLFLNYNNGLIHQEVKDTPYFNFKFDQENVPSVFTSGVWFTGKGYRNAYNSAAYLDTSDKKLNIEIESDKELYEPGEKVKLSLNLKDENGRGVSGNVNLNLVDEAYYKAVYNYLSNPLDEIYSPSKMGIMNSYISHRGPLSEQDIGGKGGCFVAGTKILMADGSYKNIEEIRKGDHILTKKSVYSPSFVPALVNSTISHEVSEFIRVNDELEVTKEHVLFINGAWKTAETLKIGDFLLNKDGNNVEVNSLEIIKKPVKVYNFEVEGQHTYFADDFYVHNDKGGDGVRSDFEDNALFQTITTDANGKGEVEFQLPDNITSWRVTAKAVNAKDLQAGVEVAAVNVSLPLFGDLTLNERYSTKDRPIIKMRAYGNSLSQNDSVDFVLKAVSLGLNSEKINGKAFTPSYFELPKLTSGKHDIILEAKSASQQDALQKTIEVIPSRFKKDIMKITPAIKSAADLSTAKNGNTEITFMDIGKAFYYHGLLNLYSSQGDRIDQNLAKTFATELLNEHFTEEKTAKSSFDPSIYQNIENGGLMLLPYGDSDLRISALISYADHNPERFSKTDLINYFNSFYTNKESNLEEIVLSLFGLANLEQPVLNSLEIIKDEEKLTLLQRLYIALAFESLGADKQAMEIYQDLKKQAIKNDNENGEVALTAILAVALEQPDALKIWQSAIAKGLMNDIYDLYQMAFIKNGLRHANATPAQFKISHNGKTETVKLDKDNTYKVFLEEGENLKLANIQGNLSAVSYYSEYADSKDLDVNQSLSLSRKYEKVENESSGFSEGELVEVILTPSARGGLTKRTYSVSDILPSGLRPVSRPYVHSIYGGDYGKRTSYPYFVDGQEISFYWNPAHSDKTITYYARVVTPGTYFAEPAKIESFIDPEIMNISDSQTIKIEKY